MKKPFLSQGERSLLNTDTLAGAGYRMNLAMAKLNREIYRETNAVFKISRYIKHKLSYWLSK